MSARRSTSSIVPASSMAARCCSRAARTIWSGIRTSAASIWARASSSRHVAPVCPSFLGPAEAGTRARVELNMGLGPRLDLRQSQSLVMTPQLQQAIRLLALSNLEVESFIAEEIEKNPLLETGAGDAEGPSEPVDLADLPDAREARDEPTVDA